MKSDAADPYAASHAGRHFYFQIIWLNETGYHGWYWNEWRKLDHHHEDWKGPFYTSQEAFGHYKDWVDGKLHRNLAQRRIERQENAYVR